MASSAQKIDFLENPSAIPPAPAISVMAGLGAKVSSALRERSGVVYIARHAADELSLGMDPRDNPSALDAASAILGAPTWVAVLSLDDKDHRQGLMSLLHQRLEVVGMPVFGTAPVLNPSALLQFSALRAWAGAALVALGNLGFLPRRVAPAELLAGTDTSRMVETHQDIRVDGEMWVLGGREQVRAVRLGDEWVLLAGSRISNAFRLAQEPRRAAQIREDLFVGFLRELPGSVLEVQVPLGFSKLEEILRYTVGELPPSQPWTRIDGGSGGENAVAGRGQTP